MHQTLKGHSCLTMAYLADQRHVPPMRSVIRCSGQPDRLPSDGSVRKVSKKDMQAKLEKAHQYKSGMGQPVSTTVDTSMAPIVRPDTSATQSSSDSSTLETDFLVKDQPQLDTRAGDELAAFVVGERTDHSGSEAARARRKLIISAVFKSKLLL